MSRIGGEISWGGRWVATPTHPDEEAFVSLRVSVEDGAGDSATVTTIRAYRIASL